MGTPENETVDKFTATNASSENRYAKTHEKDREMYFENDQQLTFTDKVKN